MSNETKGTTAAHQRISMGWLSANQRPQCGNCKDGDERFLRPDSLSQAVTWHCKQGNFPTTAHAVCQAFTARHQ